MSEQEIHEIPSSIDKFSIVFHCPYCKRYHWMILEEARYFLRSHGSIKCCNCEEKFKPHCLDIFQELQDQEREKIRQQQNDGDMMAIETGQNVDEIKILTHIIFTLFHEHDMTKTELLQSINGPDNKIEQVFTQMISNGTIMLKGINLIKEEIYGLS